MVPISLFHPLLALTNVRMGFMTQMSKLPSRPGSILALHMNCYHPTECCCSGLLGGILTYLGKGDGDRQFLQL